MGSFSDFLGGVKNEIEIVGGNYIEATQKRLEEKENLDRMAHIEEEKIEDQEEKKEERKAPLMVKRGARRWRNEEWGHIVWPK